MRRWFRIGEGNLGVESADEPLARRFGEIYGDCEVAAPDAGPTVVCRVAIPDGRTAHITFDDPEPLDIARFIDAVFPDRGFATEETSGERSIRLPGSPQVVRIAPDRLLAPADAPWQPLVANLAVSRLLRLQREVVFMHAASVRIGGRGLLACGPKRSGKTTLALALAARGHGLLGDELAAVRLGSRELLPVRRSLATRSGPRSAAVDALLAAAPGAEERFPGGERRHRYRARDLDAGTDHSRTPLTALIILRSMVPTTRITSAEVGPALLGKLTPMAASLWERPPALMALRLLGLLSAIRVFDVDAGPPDEVAERIEDLMEDG